MLCFTMDSVKAVGTARELSVPIFVRQSIILFPQYLNEQATIDPVGLCEFRG